MDIVKHVTALVVQIMSNNDRIKQSFMVALASKGIFIESSSTSLDYNNPENTGG